MLECALLSVAGHLKIYDQGDASSLFNVDFVNIAVIHFSRLFHPGQSFDHFRRVHCQTSHRIIDGEWEVMPDPFVEHNPMPRGKDEAAQVFQARNVFARYVIGFSEQHRKRLISQTNEQLSHFQMAFKPDDVSISPGNTRRAHNGRTGALEWEIVTFFNRTFVERNGQPRIGHVCPNVKPILNCVFPRRPDDRRLHDSRTVFHKSTPSTEKFPKSRPADSIIEVDSVLSLT